MLHHGSVRQVQSKVCYFIVTDTFLSFFVVFHHKNYAFIIFISFFDEISNFPEQNINQSETGIGDLEEEIN